MFKPPKFWKVTGQLSLLVDTCILSGKEQRFPDVLREFEAYRNTPIPGITVTANYGYAMMELLLPPSGWDISVSIESMLKRPKWKLYYAIGQVLQSILDVDLNEFNKRMFELLKST